MSPISRRDALRSGALACGVALAGCLDISISEGEDESPTTREVADLPIDSGVYDIYFNLARRPENVEGEYWARADNTDVWCREYRVAIREGDEGEPQFGIYRSEGC